jgi:protein-S-isoprenylcysteine O-methyltransferase Ste14
MMIWPVIPLFWIPVHCVPRFFRKLGFLTYLLPILTWLPAAFLIYSQREALLSYRIALPSVVKIVGAFVFLAGAGLQIWTLVLLSGPVIIGMPEVTRSVAGRVVSSGPFAVVRHPTYLSHTLMFLGIFLWTEVIAMAAVTVLDVFLVNLVIIPLEERELLERFGKEYEEYRTEVPSRFLPFCLPKRSHQSKQSS